MGCRCGQSPGSRLLCRSRAKVTLGPLAQSASPLAVCLPAAHIIRADVRAVFWELLRHDIRQLTCKARLLDLFRMAPSVHTHLHKAQCDGEPRCSRAHSWHNKSRAGSTFALSPPHIPLAADISQWLRGFFLVRFQRSHLNSRFFPVPFLFFLPTCRRSPVGCRSRCLQQRAT